MLWLKILILSRCLELQGGHLFEFAPVLDEAHIGQTN